MLYLVTAIVAIAAACRSAEPCAVRSSPRTCRVARVTGDVANGELGFRFGEQLGGDIAAGGRFTGAGYAALWSGGSLVHRWSGEHADDLFGQQVELVPGIGVVVTAPMAVESDGLHGFVAAYAPGGEQLWRARGERYDGLGWSLARAGDLDGDGITDLWAGATSNPLRGRVYLLSGRDGHTIRTIDGPRREDAFGWYLAATPDLDGDRVPDLAVGAPGAEGHGAVVLVSGATGQTLRELTGDGQAQRFGEMVATLDDLDGDGAPELAIGVPGNPTAPRGTGEVLVVSTRSGKTLHRIIGQHVGELFGRMVATLDDLDGDGLRDLAIGAPWSGARTGRVEIRAARSWRLLGELGGSDAGGWFGWHVARASTARGRPAIAISAIRAEQGAGVVEVHAFD